MFNVAHPKDLLIGVLAAYVITDVLISMMARGRVPSLLEKVFELANENEVMISALVGVGAGFGIYWYLNKNE